MLLPCCKGRECWAVLGRRIVINNRIAVLSCSMGLLIQLKLPKLNAYSSLKGKLKRWEYLDTFTRPSRIDVMAGITELQTIFVKKILGYGRVISHWLHKREPELTITVRHGCHRCVRVFSWATSSSQWRLSGQLTGFNEAVSKHPDCGPIFFWNGFPFLKSLDIPFFLLLVRRLSQLCRQLFSFVNSHGPNFLIVS